MSPWESVATWLLMMKRVALSASIAMGLGGNLASDDEEGGPQANVAMDRWQPGF